MKQNANESTDNLPRSINRSANSDRIIERLEEKQRIQEHYHNGNAKELTNIGTSITTQNPKTKVWEPATYQEELANVPRSYIISTPSGTQLRRNRRHLQEVTHQRIAY